MSRYSLKKCLVRSTCCDLVHIQQPANHHWHLSVLSHQSERKMQKVEYYKVKLYSYITIRFITQPSNYGENKNRDIFCFSGVSLSSSSLHGDFSLQFLSNTAKAQSMWFSIDSTNLFLDMMIRILTEDFFAIFISSTTCTKQTGCVSVLFMKTITLIIEKKRCQFWHLQQVLVTMNAVFLQIWFVYRHKHLWMFAKISGYCKQLEMFQMQHR